MGVGINGDTYVKFLAYGRRFVNVSSYPQEGFSFPSSCFSFFSDGLPFDHFAVQQQFFKRTS